MTSYNECHLMTSNPELELMEEQVQNQIIDQETQSNCACKCHPRCVSCVRCNEAFHRIPIPNHKPENYNSKLGCYMA